MANEPQEAPQGERAWEFGLASPNSCAPSWNRQNDGVLIARRRKSPATQSVQCRYKHIPLAPACAQRTDRGRGAGVRGCAVNFDGVLIACRRKSPAMQGVQCQYIVGARFITPRCAGECDG